MNFGRSGANEAASARGRVLIIGETEGDPDAAGLLAQGLRIPSDVSVVSFDGSELADWLRPRVVSVATEKRLRVSMPVNPGGSVR